MFKDARELNVIEIPLFVNRCFSVQLIHFLIRKPISHRGQQLSQVILLNGAWKAAEKGELWTPPGTLMIWFSTRSILQGISEHTYLPEQNKAIYNHIIIFSYYF